MSALRVRIVTDTQGLVDLRDVWSALAQRSRFASVFASWEWQSAWWKHYGDENALRVLVAERDDRVVGIWPLYLGTARTARVIQLRVLRQIGTGGDTTPDDLDPPIDPDHEAEVARAFVDAVATMRDWDTWFAGDLHEASPLLLALLEAKTRTHWSVSPRVSASIAWVRLPSTWEAYLATLTNDRRSKMRYDRKRIGALGLSRCFVWEDADTLDRAYDALAELHCARWKGRADRYGFSSDRYLAFHRDVVHACHRRGWLRLYCLEVDARLIAVLYCYAFRGATYYFQGGFDPALGKLRPGKVLMGYAIEAAIGEGHVAFDMLRGEYDHKAEWATDKRVTHGVEIDRPGVRGFARRWARDHGHAVKRRVAALLGRASGHDAHAGAP